MNSLSLLLRIGLGVVFSMAMMPSLSTAEETHAPAAAAPAHAEGEAHGAHDGGHAEHHEHIGEKGVNKEPQEFRTDLAIFSAIVFGLLAGGMYFTAWPKILGALEAREEGHPRGSSPRCRAHQTRHHEAG